MGTGKSRNRLLAALLATMLVFGIEATAFAETIPVSPIAPRGAAIQPPTLPTQKRPRPRAMPASDAVTAPQAESPSSRVERKGGQRGAASTESRLRALDRFAAQGTLSLDEYRQLQQQILRGD